MATRKLEVEIIGDSSSLERALGKSSKVSDGLGKSLLSLGKAAALAGAALGAAVAVGAKKAIDAASNLDEQINKTNVVFGKSGNEVEKWSEGLAESFGLSQRAALEAAGTYGNMLVPMGFTRKEAAGMSKQFVELAADMASFNNASPTDTLDALRAGLAGETEPLRRFGVFLNEARIKAEALSMGLYSGKGALDAQAKAAASAAIIMKDTADTQGDFGRTSDSLANQQRILRAELENSAAAIGTALLPAATALMGLIIEIIPHVTAWGTALTEAVGPVLVAAVQGLVPLFNTLKVSLIDLANSARTLLPTLQAIGGTAIGAGMTSLGQSAIVATAAMWGFHAVATAVQARLVAMRAAVAGASLASLITPVGLATAAVGALTAAFILSRNASDVLGNSLENQRKALQALKDVANEAVSSQDRLRDAKIGLKQATLNVSAALRERNRLEAEGKRGTDEYKQAQLNVQAAYAARIRGEHEVTNALGANREAAGKTGAAIRHLGEDAEDLRSRTFKLTGQLGAWDKELQKQGVVKGYAAEMAKLAQKAEHVSEATAKSNPRISAAAEAFARSAREAGNYAKRTGEIPPALSAVAGAAEGAGQRVGSAFGQGIYGGISSYISSITGAAAAAVRAAEQGARNEADAKSPSKVFEKVGKDLAVGLEKGITDNTAKVAAAAAKAAREAADKAAEAVRSAQSNFASAFSELASVAMNAFDAAAAQWVAPAQVLLDKRALNRQKQDLKDGLREAAQEIAAAQAELATALAGGDEAKIKESQARVLAANKAKNDAIIAQEDFNLAQRAAKQEAAHEKDVARDRIQFENRLGKLQGELARFTRSGGELTAAESRKYQAHLNDLLKDFGIDARFWGTAIGISLADGLKQAQGAVRTAALALARMIARALKTKSPTEEGPMSDLDSWWTGLVPSLIGGIDFAAAKKAGSDLASALKGGVDEQTSLAGAARSAFDFSGAAPIPVPVVDSLTLAAEAVTTATTEVNTFSAAISALPETATSAFAALTQAIKVAIKPLPLILDPGTAAANLLAGAIHNIGAAAYYTRAALKDTTNEIIDLWKRLAAAGIPLNIPGRAAGGPVRAGSPYVVGEAGPELFIPNQSGTIVANAATGSPAGGNITLQFYGPTVGTSREFEDAVRRALYDVSRRNPGIGFA